MHPEIRQIQEMVERESEPIRRIRLEVGTVIVGQDALVLRLLVGVLADGHLLLEGVPGLAKTLAVKTLAGTLNAKFSRLQFTPDLLPADLIGTLIYNPKTAEFTTRKGPVFANLILADEINRAPAKVQSALLEAMQERQVTIGEASHPLPELFLVLATQNPIEQEGTYPLPEAQLDRFLLKVKVDYPSREEERQILDRMTGPPLQAVRPVATPEEILRARSAVRMVYVDDKIREYVLDIVSATRRPKEFGLEIAPWISYGASPRATLYLTTAAKAHAFIQGRAYVTPDDVKALALDVLRHRILTTYEAEAKEITAEQLATQVLEAVPVP
ncbi:MAG: MoxR family ATPase [Candidatus Eisenbacteria bacterium]|nr:MoxR family ATPase [Candidatus Eisenbacteria bacterium]